MSAVMLASSDVYRFFLWTTQQRQQSSYYPYHWYFLGLMRCLFVWGRNPTNTTQQLIFSDGLSVLGKHNRAVTFLFFCLFVCCCWEAQPSSNFAYLWRWPHRMFVRAGRGKHCSTSTATSLTLLPHYLLWGWELLLSSRVLCFTICAECKSFIIRLNLFSEIES